MPKKQLPDGWEPPVPAWQTEYPESVREIVFAYFGAQRPEGAKPGEFVSQLRASILGNHEPSFVTRATYVDATNFRNDVFIAYWPSLEAYEAWWRTSEFSSWWSADNRVSEGEGLWREIYSVRPQRFETLFSSRNPTGAAALGCPFGEPVREHNYWGGMRDRIADTTLANDSFEPSGEHTSASLSVEESRRQRIRVDLPDNICLIRSGQDFSQCGAQERSTYEDVVRPHLTAGMAFLRDNPIESGCLSCRLMDEVDLDGQFAAKSFGLAAFSSLAHLESWAKSHPSHLAIFESFFRMVEMREGKLDLRLWHEVLILDAQGSLCEYVNCHPNTGFLRWFRP
ncbi:phenylacetaldoxime dehydratase family protein [Novosphingobium jiangmenense]|uniref:Phenylacetaldoxime dehydratase family protein n=1 Tax=Novosphingobium jiangmenense TaxID=2791981 RepID=A0ABS0HHV3_9SPHN|nr:phenylacetaldoxime dehydratase family protein [Novosphingobium jiangmenense]MBF9151738.1 phenylacetaldoxime dehydratase family protein [Novosphingobium jiangmenense]